MISTVENIFLSNKGYYIPPYLLTPSIAIHMGSPCGTGGMDDDPPVVLDVFSITYIKICLYSTQTQ